MGFYESANRTATAKTVDRNVRRNVFKQFTEDPALEPFEAEFGGLDETRATIFLEDPSVSKVVKPRGNCPGVESAEVGEPFEFPHRHIKPLCQVPDRANRREFPGGGCPGSRTHLGTRAWPNESKSILENRQAEGGGGTK